MEEAPFKSKCTKTMRSPVSKENIPVTPLQQDERLKKRKINEINNNDYMSDDEECARPVSNEDIYKLIKAQSALDSNERKLIKDELTSEIRSINEKIISIENNVKEIDKKVDAVTLLAQQNKKIINSLCQDKIDKSMEIDGIQKRIIDECRDLRKLAVETIESFKIKISVIDIERVTKKDVQIKNSNGNKSDKTILTVHFKEFETKLNVMREKRKIKDDRKIFFNPSLTPTNRFLMGNARNTAKLKNLKVFFKNGRVNVEKSNKEIMVIENEDDLVKLKIYVEELQKSDSNQSTSFNMAS